MTARLVSVYRYFGKLVLVPFRYFSIDTYRNIDIFDNTSPHKSPSLCGKICITPPKCLRKERRRNFYSRCSIVVVGTLCVSKYGKGRNISLTCLRYSANHNALDSWPIRAHSAFQNDELLKIDVFQKGGAERSNNTVRYVENNVFFLP